MTSSVIASTSAACKKAYQDAGFALFKMLHGTKASPPKGWNIVEPGQDVNGASAFGINLAPEDLVLDVDPRRYENDVSQLSLLWNELSLPNPVNTYIVATPSGGLHIYFKRKGAVTTGKTEAFERLHALVPGYPAIEVKTVGRYILGAGSATDRGEYLVKRGSPSNVLRVPDSLLSFVTKPKSDAKRFEGVSSDDDDTKRRFVQYLMRQPGIISGGRNNELYKHVCEGRDYGLSSECVEKLVSEYWNIRCTPALEAREVKATCNSVYTYAKNRAGCLNPDAIFASVPGDLLDAASADLREGVIWWDKVKTGPNKGDVKPTLNNAVNYLRLPPAEGRPNRLYQMLRYNSFSGNVEFKREPPWNRDAGPWQDEDTVQLKYWLSVANHVEFNNIILEEAVLIIAKRDSYHPVKEYLESLQWDEVPRLDTWLETYCGSPSTRYHQEVGKNTILAAVARIFDPGCQHDHMLILEGKQGSQKSTVVRILGGPWYADVVIDPHEKDTVLNMQDAWICEASEMEFLRGRDMASLKAFLTKVEDKIRKPFGRRSSKLPRHTIFIGTVNPDGGGYLSDTTGNRRFWAVTTSFINVDKLRRDRDQLFAEAVVRFRNGEKFYITDKLVEKCAEREAYLRMMSDSWADLVNAWLIRQKEEKTMPDTLTLSDIAYGALSIYPAQITKGDELRLARVLNGLGWQREQKWSVTYQTRTWCWVEVARYNYLEGL